MFILLSGYCHDEGRQKFYGHFFSKLELSKKNDGKIGADALKKFTLRLGIPYLGV